MGEEAVAQALALARPSTSPPMSTNWTLAGTTFADGPSPPTGRGGGRAPWPRRSGRWWRARTAWRARRHRQRVGQRDDFPALGRPTNPNRSITLRPAPQVGLQHRVLSPRSLRWRSSASRSSLAAYDRTGAAGPQGPGAAGRAVAGRGEQHHRWHPDRRSRTWGAGRIRCGAVDAVEALERIAYLRDRKLDPPQKAAAFLKAADVVQDLGRGDSGDATPTRKLEELPGIQEGAAAVITQALAGQVPDRLHDLEESSVIPLSEGRPTGRPQGRLPSPRPGATAARSIETMARSAMALGHEYMVLTDHSPRLTIAHGLKSAERLRAQLEEIAALNERLAPFGSSPASRWTSWWTAGSTSRGSSPSSTWSWPASTRRSRCLGADDRADGDGGGQPARGHPRALHRSQAAVPRRVGRPQPGHLRLRAGRRGVPSSTPRSRSTAARAAGPAGRPARPGPRLGPA